MFYWIYAVFVIAHNGEVCSFLCPLSPSPLVTMAWLLDNASALFDKGNSVLFLAS